MKEIRLLTEWADKISEAPVQSNRMGTPMKGVADRPLPRKIDVAYKAQRAHPELSPDQALALYMSDELEKNDQMNLEQNKVINAQKRQNLKLSRSLDELGKELHDTEAQAEETDQEVQRLKDLSAKLKPAGELSKTVAQATSQQIEKMLKDVDDLRNKPGMTPEKQKEIEEKINSMKSGGLSSDEVNNINNTLEVLTSKQEVDDLMFDKVMGKLEKTQYDLEKKEKRFQKSITRNAEKIGQWGNKFSDLDNKIAAMNTRAEETAAEIDKKVDSKLAEIDRATQEADETLDRIAMMVRQLNPSVARPAAQALSTLDDRDEVKQAMGKPSATTLPSTDPYADFDDSDVEVIDYPDYTSDMYDDPDNPEHQQDIQQQKQNVIDLLNKYRKPTNVKNNGQLGEQIEMQEPADEVETVIIPKLVSRYKRMYPTDLRKWSEGQLVEILRRTVDRRLLIWAPDIDEERVSNYLAAVHGWLRKLRPVQPELFDLPDPQNKPVAESVFADFEKNLAKLSGGY